MTLAHLFQLGEKALKCDNRTGRDSGGTMFHVSELSIESVIPMFLMIAWGTISAYQILAAKLRKKRCLICNRPVLHEEQASYVALPCHDRCIYLATLMAKTLKHQNSHMDGLHAEGNAQRLG